MLCLLLLQALDKFTSVMEPSLMPMNKLFQLLSLNMLKITISQISLLSQFLDSSMDITAIPFQLYLAVILQLTPKIFLLLTGPELLSLFLNFHLLNMKFKIDKKKIDVLIV
jgi:hypothetical protein